MQVLIVDVHWISKAGLSHLLSLMDPECGIIETTTFEESAALLAAHPFDVCLVGPVIAKGNPLDGLKTLHEVALEIALIVITT